MGASILLLLSATAAEPLDGLRPLHEVQQQLSQLLKQESETSKGQARNVQARNVQARAKVVREMCALHAQIVSDPRFTTSDALKQYRGQLWSRLTKVKGALVREFGRAESLPAADEVSLAMSASLGDSLAILEQTQGGPGQWAALGGGAVAADWGPDLVELIERTINPAFWDVAGGPGTIVYYGPLQCLVVRATSEVHGQVGGLVGELRRGR